MKSLKPILLQELKNTLDKAFFQFRVYRDMEGVDSLTRGERIVGLLSKYDTLYPERQIANEEVLKIWQELQEYLEQERASLRNEYIELNIRKDWQKNMKRKISGYD